MDLVNVLAGVMEAPFTWVVMHPSMFVERGCNVYLAEVIKKPVGCVRARNDLTK